MENLIPVVNRLQDVFETIGQKSLLDLPQIVVIGSQSSGKSSVLEGVLGKEFLPRNAGICTRRPLVLQLVQNNKSKDEWAEFLHIPNRKFTDFDQVRREIEIETDREAGRNKGMSSKAIRLKVCSPSVLNLTLVDLPGITKVPVGDQPANIEQITREMCLEYITNPLSIILAVSPANADLANSESIKFAKEVDPAGNRTIGVLTKLDLVDDGVDALDALTGQIIPLKRGYIGIINRSQAEINGNKPIREIRQKENAFFLNHPAYRSIANRQGTEYLTKSLNSILLNHIREHLPDIKSNVQKQIREIERELALLGNDVVDPNDTTTQGQLILTIINKYCNTFIDSIEGRQTASDDGIIGNFSSNSTFAANGGLYGGARLSIAFKQFSTRLLEISPFTNLSDAEIRVAITNATGPRPSLFVPELSFELLVKRQLSNLQEPAMNCVMEVYEILQEVADQSCFSGLRRFKALQDQVVETVNKILIDSLHPTQVMIENLIKVEKAFINTSHPDFVAQLHAVRDGTALTPSKESFESKLFSAGGCENIKSGSSVASEPPSFDNNSKTYNNLDYENNEKESLSIEGIDGGAASDEENHDTNKKVDTNQTKSNSSNFMSYIFSERVTKKSADSSSVSSSISASNTLASAAFANTNGTSTNPYLSTLGQNKTRATTSSFSIPESPNYSFNGSEQDSQVKVIKRLINAYLAISKKNVLDLTPKTVMHFLVNFMKENIHTELIRALYKQELFTKLLQENEQIASKRRNCQETSKLLNRALVILNSVREFKLS